MTFTCACCFAAALGVLSKWLLFPSDWLECPTEAVVEALTMCTTLEVVRVTLVTLDAVNLTLLLVLLLL